MILTDPGPIVALQDKDDPNHTKCLEASKRLPGGSLFTTGPCFTETMSLLGEVGGYRYEAELWKLQKAQRLILHDLTVPEIKRMATLMEKYQDIPTDLADASLVAVAESRSLNRVFTLDSDFNIYRLADGVALKLIP